MPFSKVPKIIKKIKKGLNCLGGKSYKRKQRHNTYLFVSQVIFYGFMSFTIFMSFQICDDDDDDGDGDDDDDDDHHDDLHRGP